MKVSSEIEEYYKLIDKFLLEQFKMGMGESSSKRVLTWHKKILNFLNNLKFEIDELEFARLRTIDEFNGLSVAMGFPELEKLSKNITNTEILEKLRVEIDTSIFLPKLNKLSDIDFDEKGTNLNGTPSEWFQMNDIKISKDISPEDLKQILFERDNFNTSFKYNFKISPEKSGFFMMTLHLEDSFYIGYRPSLTLFALSTLAHEIGHTTTLRKNDDLQSRFLEVKDDFLINNELDSYRYEYLFAKKCEQILNKLNIEIKNKGFENLLLKRKAIQFNLHLAAIKLNHLYFSGTNINVIRDEFINMITRICPSFVEQSELDWMDFATLGKPLLKVGYIQAYQKVFIGNKKGLL